MVLDGKPSESVLDAGVRRWNWSQNYHFGEYCVLILINMACSKFNRRIISNLVQLEFHDNATIMQSDSVFKRKKD